MIFQHFNLLSSRTVHDNVALPLELAGVPRADIKRARRALLELVGLADNARPLSGADRPAARSSAWASPARWPTDPKVLLSDEATSALDPETTRSILALLRQINRDFGLTIVLITHEMQVIKQSPTASRFSTPAASWSRARSSTCSPGHATRITRSLLDDLIAAGTARERDRAHPLPDGGGRGGTASCCAWPSPATSRSGRCCRT